MSTINLIRSKTPSHIAYQVREGKDEKSFFTRVGVAFVHRDGKGFNILLDAMPVDGKITLRELPEDQDHDDARM